MAFSNGTHPPLADGTTVEYLGRVEDLHHRMLTTRRGTSTYDTYTDENGTQQHLYDLLDDGELALSHVHPDDLTAWSPATDGNELPLDSSSPQQG